MGSSTSPIVIQLTIRALCGGGVVFLCVHEDGQSCSTLAEAVIISGRRK